MKTNPESCCIHHAGLELIVAALFLSLLSQSIWAADAVEPPRLRYQFQPGTTNAFKIELETKTGEEKVSQEGTLIVVTKAAESQTATVSFQPKMRPSTAPMRPSMFSQGWNPFEFRVGMYTTPFPCQIEIDQKGRVLRTMGELNLPPPFDELYRLLFPVLPESAANQWTNRSDQWLPADSWGGDRRFPPYYGPMGPGSRALARMAAHRQEDCQIVSVNNNMAHLRHQLTIESWARWDDAARWRITGNTEVDFDVKAGQPLSLEAACTAVWTSEAITRRAPMVLRCTRMPEAELKDLLAAMAPTTPTTVNENELRKLLLDVESRDPDKKTRAINTLMMSTVSSLSPETIATLEAQVKTTDSQIRMVAGRILAQHATSAHVPWLLGLLKSSDPSLRAEAIQALGRLKEKRAVEPLVEMVGQGAGEFGAVEALKQIGAPAEPAVLTLLRERHQETRRRACEILQQIGTQRSLEPLRALRLSSDEMLGNAARQAAQEIEARWESGRDSSTPAGRKPLRTP